MILRKIIKVLAFIVFIALILAVILLIRVKNYETANLNDSAVSAPEITDFPLYHSRHIEQTYLTLPEWYQVYNYNEFGDFLQSGGRQTDFPFIGAILNFWDYYVIALGESREEKFNFQYNFVDWVIGVNLTFEYSVKWIYENTVGRFSQFIAGSDTQADKFIANSWNSYAEKMYQETWYHYDYFNDLKGIWSDTALFDKKFVRNLERKIAFSVSYFVKGTYAKIWLATAVQKENKTFSIVNATKKDALTDEKVKIIRELGGDNYLIETERYAGFKDIFLRLLEKRVKFIEIMGHNVIALSYKSKIENHPFSDSRGVKVLDIRELFHDQDGYRYRVTLKSEMLMLPEVIEILKSDEYQFEMIYDF